MARAQITNTTQYNARQGVSIIQEPSTCMHVHILTCGSTMYFQVISLFYYREEFLKKKSLYHLSNHSMRGMYMYIHESVCI